MFIFESILIPSSVTDEAVFPRIIFNAGEPVFPRIIFNACEPVFPRIIYQINVNYFQLGNFLFNIFNIFLLF